MKRVAVIGAGPAGLSAAWQLSAAGADVTLFERGGLAGGKLRTERIGGAVVDVGVQLVSSTYTSLLELVGAAGARAQLQRSPGRDALWRKGRAHAITYGSVASMVTSGALPATLKLKLGAKYLPYLTTHARHLDANEPARAGAAEDVESIAAWGRRELGAEFVDLLAYPLLAAYYGSAAEHVTAPLYHALARVGMDVSVMGATAGFGGVAASIMAALQARGVHVHTHSRVGRVAPSDRGVRVEVGRSAAASRAGSPQSDVARHAAARADLSAAASHEFAAQDFAAQDFDAAVVAVPAPAARALLQPDGALAQWLEGIVVRPTFTVCYRMERPYPGDYFGLSFPRRSEAGDVVAALCIQSRKLPGLVPDGDALVALPAPAAVPALLRRADDEIAAETLRALERVVSGITRRVVSAHVFRYDEGYTQFDVGQLRRIAAFDAAWLPASIALAGDYLTAPTVEGAVRSGTAAARRLLS